jgi:hypothetical protein
VSSSLFLHPRVTMVMCTRCIRYSLICILPILPPSQSNPWWGAHHVTQHPPAALCFHVAGAKHHQRTKLKHEKKEFIASGLFISNIVSLTL